METMIMIGANPESVKMVGEFIIEIINSNCDTAVKTVALETLRKASNVDNTTIQNCTLYGEYKEGHGKTSDTRNEGDDSPISTGEAETPQD